MTTVNVTTAAAAAPIDLEALALVACPDCNGCGYGEDHGVVFFCASCDGGGRVWYPVALLRWKGKEAA